ncbi:MAG TPA: hypothetical protein VLM44_05760 [Lutibacter sp.]|nr:hypothetical protein [Lutibacter sp.]
MKKIIAILIFILLSSCHKKDHDLAFEKNVMNEIFTDLVDAIYTDMRTVKIPSRPFLAKGTYDKLKSHQIALAEREKRIIKIKNDTSRIVLAIYDTITKITNRTAYNIDLSKLNKSNTYIFKYWSDFPKGRKIWNTKYPFYFGGIISFSRIEFDWSKKSGVLTAGISYADQDAQGFDIYIKKSNNKWIIEKVVETWIS